MFSNPSLLTIYPGFTQCQVSCGCAGCGCFYCDDACLYSRYYFQPVGNLYTLTSIPFFNRKVTLTALLCLSGETCITYNIPLNGFSQTIGPLTITPSGQFQNVNYGYTYLPYLVVDSTTNEAWFTEASSINRPEYGLIGDIQAPFHNWLDDSASLFFSFPTDQLYGIDTGSAVIYSVPSTGIHLLRGGNSGAIPLPWVDPQGIAWAFSGGNLIGVETNPSAVVLTITSIALTATYSETVICPILQVVKVTGCYDCIIGFSITITAYSTCSAGSVMIVFHNPQGFSCAVSAVTIGTTPSPQTISCLSSISSIDTSICLKFGTIESCMPLKGVLIYEPLTPDMINQLDSNYTIASDGPNLSGWLDSLTGGAKVGMITMITIVSVIGAVMVLMTIAYVVKSFIYPLFMGFERL